jgi:hypothetical protein
MRLFSRPSHYQITFLVIFLGIAWGTSGEKWFRRYQTPSLNRGLSQKGEKFQKGFVKIGKARPKRTSERSNTAVDYCGRVLGEIAGNPNTESTPKGSPLSKVKLELVPLGKGDHSSQGILSFFSGKEGEFRFSKLLPGRYILRALPTDGKHLSKAISFEIPKQAFPTTKPRTNPGLQSSHSELSDPNKALSASPTQLDQEIILPLPRKMLGHLSTEKNSQKTGVDQRGYWISVSENGLHRGTAQTGPKGIFFLNGVGTGPYDFTLRDQDGEVLPVKETSLKPDAKHQKVLVSLITP